MMDQGREALAVCSDKSMKIGITIWDIDTGDQILRIPSCAASCQGLLCVRNQYLAASQVNRHGSLGGGIIFMWPLNKPQPPRRNYTIEAIGPISCSKDGIYLAGGTPTGNAYLWELSSQYPISQDEFLEGDTYVAQILYCRAASIQFAVILVTSGRLLRMWHAHCKSIKCMVFSDDSSLLISGSDDGMICVWSMIRLTKKTSEMMHHSNQLDQSFLKIEDLGSSPALLHYSVEHKSSITGLLTLSGGTGSLYVSSSLDATCKVWETTSGRLIQTQVYPLALTAIAFHLGQQLLFAGSVDGRIFVNTLEFLRVEDPFIVTENQPSVLKGHNGSITALVFSESHLISASEDKTVCLWDITRRMIIRRFNNQNGPVTNVVVIPQSSLFSEVSNHQRKSKKNSVSSLEKFPQPYNKSKGMITLLHSWFSNKDDPYLINLQRNKSFYWHMSEFQLEGTPAAMQLRAEISMSYQICAARMTKHVMEMNKLLQSRLLDLMQYRLLRHREINSASTKSRKKCKIESPSMHKEELNNVLRSISCNLE